MVEEQTGYVYVDNLGKLATSVEEVATTVREWEEGFGRRRLLLSVKVGKPWEVASMASGFARV